VLLVRGAHHEIAIRLPVDVADQTVALVQGLPRSPAVARQGHPARVDEQRALLGPVPDDRRQDAERRSERKVELAVSRVHQRI